MHASIGWLPCNWLAITIKLMNTCKIFSMQTLQQTHFLDKKINVVQTFSSSFQTWIRRSRLVERFRNYLRHMYEPKFKSIRLNPHCLQTPKSLWTICIGHGKNFAFLIWAKGKMNLATLKIWFLAMHLIPLIQLFATIKGACGPDLSAVPQFLSLNRSMVIAEAVHTGTRRRHQLTSGEWNA